MTIQDFPAIDASLNALSGCFVICGWLFIRSGKKNAHRASMLCAVVISAAFLCCYLTGHYLLGVTHFLGQGWARPFYFALLLTHTILATAIVPLVIFTLIPAFRKRFDKHRRIARWTLPIWLYVSVSGVLVYFMLFQWFPHQTVPLH